MIQHTTGYPVPEASICINKSQLKLYNKQDKFPTYYLDNGQEFQIQLFNPTQDTILAKIQLNGKAISQGGLVIKPGERVFLERYLDIAKKFLFETYEVSNTNAVKQAIANNGDFKVEFYRESQVVPISNTITTTWPNVGYPDIYTYDANKFGRSTLIGRSDISSSAPASMDWMSLGDSFDNSSALGQASLGETGLVNGVSSTNQVNFTNASNSYFSHTLGETTSAQYKSPGVTTREADLSTTTKQVPSTKTIETGRVEAGSDSNQQITYVNKSWEYYAFHTVEYKLLPTSQKINTTKDLQVARYCHSCGNRRKPEHKFCPACGTKL
jgi:hypothetical protein